MFLENLDEQNDSLSEDVKAPERSFTGETSSPLAMLKTFTEKPSYLLVRGTYGSCNRNEVRGRLEELHLVLPKMKEDFHKFILEIALFVILWPFAVMSLLVLVPAAYLIPKESKNGYRLLKLTQAVTLWAGISLCFWAIPIICLIYMFMSSDSAHEFWERLNRIAKLDMVQLVICPGVFMAMLCWAWIAEEAHAHVSNVTKHMNQSMSQQYADFPPLNLSRQQTDAMMKAAAFESPPLQLDKFMSLIQDMPGFETAYVYEKDRLKDLLVTLRNDEALEAQGGLNLLDKFILSDLYECPRPDFHETALGVGMRAKIKYCYVVAKHTANKTPISCILLLGAACLRAAMPKLWPWFHHNKPIFDHDLGVAICSTYADVIFGCILAAGYLMGQAANYLYGRNEMQMSLLTALIDVQARASYAMRLANTHHRMDTVNILAKLPLLDCRHMSNVNAWWLLREYTLLDQCNETLMVQVVIEIAVLGEMAMLLVGLWYMIEGGDKAELVLLCVTVDLIAVTFLMVKLILTSFRINSHLDTQLKRLVLVRHDVWGKWFDSSLSDDKQEPDAENATALADLISHLVEKLERNDERQKLFFGLEVTPIGVLVFGFTVVTAIFGLLEQLISLGVMRNTFQTLEA